VIANCIVPIVDHEAKIADRDDNIVDSKASIADFDDNIGV